MWRNAARFWCRLEHADIIAGQGTCGLEIIAALAGLGVELDDMLVNCSGGGLTAGIAPGIFRKVAENKGAFGGTRGF